ncbi:hypothetical protein GGX14DRAFT_605759 [Mycena pura]|uniref:Uncharacterized protein n=1 Tax=Mycena pura TaxID=153505 RepID=A0AAD6UQ28_9AGAR|nr:hypothetical protein GGX14DRAFT_605759 [Mycena pura]
MLKLWLTILVSALLSTASNAPHWYHRNKNTIQSIYDLTVYPNNARVIAGGAAAVPPGLFNANATGRVTPVGEFNGFQDSIEYFWGLAPLPTGVPPNGVITKATLMEFTSGCAQVAASTVYLRVNTLNPDNSTGALIGTLKQIAFWHFDHTGAVLKYDAWIPNLDPFTSLLFGVPDFLSPAMENTTLQAVCAGQAQRCVGPNQVYADADACVATLSARPFGRMDEAWGDNVCCRFIHLILAAIRPEVHCPHVGPTGGGKCIDIPYNQAYFDDKQLFGSRDGTFDCETYW